MPLKNFCYARSFPPATRNHSMTRRNADGEPRAAYYRGTSDQEYRVVAGVRGSRRRKGADFAQAVEELNKAINRAEGLMLH
jgi:hypothetical protein